MRRWKLWRCDPSDGSGGGRLGLLSLKTIQKKFFGVPFIAGKSVV
jgi:hypothetical protein